MEVEPFILLTGDSLERLKALPDASIDACVTDPPYGLSEHRPEDVAACLTAWLAGQEYRPKKKGFMGRVWDAWVPGPELWREVYRVLKPGGHVLAMAGSRTQDLMGMAIRLAGFECRDSLDWLYSQGFPKSLDVSKAIDKAAGAEREVVGIRHSIDCVERGYTKDYATRAENSGFGTSGVFGSGSPITAPTTEAAKQWDGWGTALKPSKEPIIVARKPLAGTVAANVVKYGTGGLNIDGCRVGREHSILISTGQMSAVLNVQARWPPNVLLSHAPACIQVGFATVAGDARSNNPEATDGERPGGFGDIGADKGEGKPNAAVYGNEEVPVWACVPGCPVRALDDQAGQKKAVSRFFPILPIDNPTTPPFFYSAKTSTAERNAGLPEGETNKHPTVKPLALCRWLLRLVVPPGGVVLDPFCGSGSFGCAAMVEGFGFVGIDLDAEHIQVSRFRILSAWRGSRTEP